MLNEKNILIPDIDDVSNAFVITIDDKRYEMFCDIFDFYGIPIPQKFEGVKCDNGVIGCSKSHYSVVKLAKERNLPYVMIYEDDAFPRNDCLEHFFYSMENVPKDWDFLKLEDIHIEQYDITCDVNDYWFRGKVGGGSGTGCYIIRESGYDMFIRQYDNCGFHYPSDLILCDLMKNPFMKFYIQKKLCFLQHNIHGCKTMHTGLFTLSKQKYLAKYYSDDVENFDVSYYMSHRLKIDK